MRTLSVAALLLWPAFAFGGGPKWIAGKSYFDPAVKGQALHWKNGQLNYYLDEGVLSSDVSHALAATMVAQAAAQWSSVATAAINIVEAGILDEDVSGANVLSTPGAVTFGWSQAPADIQSTALNKPLAVIFDDDGAVLDAMLGPGASDPLSCRSNSVVVVVDAMGVDATLQHALMVVNGRCTHSSGQLAVLNQAIVRGFGRILGLDWSQANDCVFMGDYEDFAPLLAGWPLMHPIEPVCDALGGPCFSNGMAPRLDDIAALGRIYPVTPANSSGFPSKTVTASATVSIQGFVRFPTGQGMQGINIVAYPLISGTNQPDLRYPVSAVTGEYFQGDQGNPVTGYLDGTGNRFDRFGSDDASLEGYFDLSAMPLPPGQNQADYVLTFEKINPLYERESSVGAQWLGAPTPAGTMPTVVISGLTAGTVSRQDFTISDAPSETHSGNDGRESSPVMLPPAGEWGGRVTGYGHSGWFAMWVKADRYFTVEAAALDDQGQLTPDKARVVLGVWNAIQDTGSPSTINSIQAVNGIDGRGFLGVQTLADGELRLGVADERGDGRPDYVYRGRVLYAEDVIPAHLPTSGGQISIEGMGFRAGNTVWVGGVPAIVTSVLPRRITAIVQPAAPGQTGEAVVEVDDPETGGAARIGSDFSFDAASADALNLITSPTGMVPINVPQPFRVRAEDASLHLIPGLSVNFSVDFGGAVLGCGLSACSVTAGGDGVAEMAVYATSPTYASVTAMLSNGSSVRTTFTGGIAPTVNPLNSHLFLARGAAIPWQPVALVLQNGIPAVGTTVTWSGEAGALVQTPVSKTDGSGRAVGGALVGPLGAGVDVSLKACVNSGTVCGDFTVSSVYPEYAGLLEISGAGQSMPVADSPAPILLQAVDAGGHPLAGAVVSLSATLYAWSPRCPAEDRCRASSVLQTQAAVEISDANGMVSFVPLARPEVATRLVVSVATGLLAELSFEIERHP